MVDEEVDKILNHIQSKLPPEVLQDLNVMGNMKSYLHTYYNTTFQNMINRYLTTAEDELGKKLRDMIDKEEHQALNRYTPREIASLINHIGGPEIFNTEEVEKSVVNIMGHLQGHIQRGTFEFEAATNDILMQHTDVGSFIRGDNTYAVVKCSFRDNYKKPEEVVDIKLAINILDSEL
ncbi:MAG TPA: cytoplasmic filament protein CfpA, partial [bacterium]|nr:cytoplasmic filament protein CfpA [bacterium]